MKARQAGGGPLAGGAGLLGQVWFGGLLEGSGWVHCTWGLRARQAGAAPPADLLTIATRFPPAEGYTKVSTVVERILASAADSEAGSGSVIGSAAASTDSLTALEAAAAAKAGPAPLPPVHGGLAAGIAALHAGSVVSTGSPHASAKRSTFSLAAAAGPGAAAAAAEAPAPPADWQQQQQAAVPVAGLAAQGAEGQRHRRLWSGAAAGPPRAGTLGEAQQAAAAAGAAAAAEEEEAEEELEPADDPCGLLLLQQLEQQAAAAAVAAPLGAPGGGVSKPPALATVAEDAAAVEASAQSRHEAAEASLLGVGGE